MLNAPPCFGCGQPPAIRVLTLADDSSSVYQFFCPQCDRYVPYIGHAVVRVPGLQLEYTNEDRWAAWHRKVDRKVTLIESGEFETDPYDSNDADDLFNASALLGLDRGSNISAPCLPTDPDRDQLRRDPITTTDYGFREPEEFTSYLFWQGELRPVRPQPDFDFEPSEPRPPTPDLVDRPARGVLATSARGAGLVLGLSSLEDYSGDELVFKLRDVLYLLGLSTKGSWFALLRRLLAFKTGENSGYLIDVRGVNIRADNINWRNYQPERLRYSDLLKLCYGLGVLNDTRRVFLEHNVKSFKNDIYTRHDSPRIDWENLPSLADWAPAATLQRAPEDFNLEDFLEPGTF